MAFNYDRYATSGTFVKFEEVGDQVAGVIKTVREGKTFKGDPCPELVIEDKDGEERIVTAGQVMLRQALAEQQPQERDKVRITYSGVGEAKPGQAPPKLFTVEVKKGPHELTNAAVANSEEPF